MNPSNTWASLKTLSEKYGEIFKIKVLGKTIVFVAGADLVDEVCDETRFRKFVGGPIVEIRYAVHDALFTAYVSDILGVFFFWVFFFLDVCPAQGRLFWSAVPIPTTKSTTPASLGQQLTTSQDKEPSWGIAHRICAPRLSRDAVAHWCSEMADITGELVAKWSSSDSPAGRGDGVLLMDDLNRLNLEVTTQTLFGKKLGCITAARDHPMLKGMEDATSEAMKRPTRPGIANWLFFGSKFRSATKTMRGYAEDLVRDRQQHPTGREAHRKDLLSALMEGTDPQTGLALTESQVVDEIVSMPIGSSTAPCAIAAAVYFLLRRPECVAEARRELDEVLGPWGGGAAGKAAESGRDADGGARLDAQSLPKLRYVRAIVREALRLSFAAPGFNVEPIPRAGDGMRDETPIVLGGGKYSVAYDQAMIVVLAGANRDVGVFGEDALEFRPERMMGTDEEIDARLPKGARRWFGNGKRECIGKNWAMQFCVVAMAVLLREVDFEMVDPGYELKQDGWFNLRPVGFRVRARPRGCL